MKLTHVSFVLLMVLVIGQIPIAAGQDTERPAVEPWIGEVSGNDVYLRSGPSTNYYPVTKLSAGTRVEVFGEENGWLAIAPPEGVFSLIDNSYVDKDQGNQGVVNGNRVNVRAGSDLSRAKYAKQKQLDRGAIVTIIGEDDEGYYKIVPPEGVRVWISTQFITRVPTDRLELEAKQEQAKASEPVKPKVVTTQPAKTDKAEEDKVKAEDKPSPLNKPAIKEKPSDLSTTPKERKEKIVKLRKAIEAIEVELAEELKKPLLNRDYAEFSKAYTPIAEQETDAYSQAWAKTRLTQLEEQIELADAVRRVREIREKAHNERREFATRRANIRTVPVPVDKGFAAEGELRESRIYNSPNGPRRYRLIDPNAEKIHTLYYIEVPRDMDFDAKKYLGRMVGIHAREKFLKADGVDPVPVIIAAKVVLLDQKKAIEEPESPAGKDEKPTGTK